MMMSCACENLSHCVKESKSNYPDYKNHRTELSEQLESEHNLVKSSFILIMSVIML